MHAVIRHPCAVAAGLLALVICIDLLNGWPPYTIGHSALLPVRDHRVPEPPGRDRHRRCLARGRLDGVAPLSPSSLAKPPETNGFRGKGKMSHPAEPRGLASSQEHGTSWAVRRGVFGRLLSACGRRRGREARRTRGRVTCSSAATSGSKWSTCSRRQRRRATLRVVDCRRDDGGEVYRLRADEDRGDWTRIRAGRS